MAIKDRIISLLQTSAVIQSVAGGRIYHQFIPQDAPLPCVRFELTEAKPHYTLEGQTSLTPGRFLFDCVADKSADGRALGDAVVAFKGAPQSTASINGASLRRIFVEAVRDNYDQPQQADERGVRHVEVDLTIWYTEP